MQYKLKNDLRNTIIASFIDIPCDPVKSLSDMNGLKIFCLTSKNDVA